MRRISFVALVVFVITLSSAAAQAQQKFSKVVTDADRWSAVEYDAPSECTGPSEECAIKMLTELKIGVGDEPDFSVYPLGEIGDKNVTVVFVSHLVEDDDSVLGKLYRLELSQSDEGDSSFELAGLGRMFQCMNGPVGWRKTSCP